MEKCFHPGRRQGHVQEEISQTLKITGSRQSLFPGTNWFCIGRLSESQANKQARDQAESESRNKIGLSQKTTAEMLHKARKTIWQGREQDGGLKYSRNEMKLIGADT